MFNREKAIQNIHELFSPDSSFFDTALIGEQLLEQAKRETNFESDWRNLPDNVIKKFEELCIAEKKRQANLALSFLGITRFSRNQRNAKTATTTPDFD